MSRHLDEEEVMLLKRSQNRQVDGFEIPNRGISLVSETGIYECIFNSHKPEAKEFKKWVKQLLKEFRKQLNLEAYELFEMVNKS